MEQLKLLGMTFVLTLLIWTSADRLVNETATIGAVLEPVSAITDSDMQVRLDPPNRYFEIQLSGPRKNIEAAQEAAPLKLRYSIVERSTGRVVIPIERDKLKQQLEELSPEFRRLSVIAVQPNDLAVLVDRFLRKDIELSLGRLNLSYDEKPRIQPNSVSVRLRESRLVELNQGGPWQVLDISAEAERLLREKPAGEPAVVLVPLDSRPFGPDADITPKVVEVAAVLQAARTIAEIPAVPIRVAISFGNLQRGHRAVTPDGTTLELVTQTISVAGPAEEVGKLLRGDAKAFGIIQLKEADFEELGLLKSVIPEFELPKGLDLASKPQPIEFKIVPLESPSGSETKTP